MISIEDRFFSLHRTLLLAIGLWPYQKSKLAQLHFICCFSSIVSLIIFQVKNLMEQLQHMCDNLKDNNEIAIVEKYGNNAKRYTIILTIMVGIGLSTMMIVHLWPAFFHFILSVNQSRPRHLQIMAEYFVDQEKYFYLLLFHTIAAISIGIFAVVATGTMLIAFLQHACGMFRIAR
nr:PREDICTED: uncharacterized protein LOC105677617 [Linepithema humile]